MSFQTNGKSPDDCTLDFLTFHTWISLISNGKYKDIYPNALLTYYVMSTFNKR